ncbi:MAG: TolC family protein [Lutibacter sp.]|uniref:TolC family protein n=1 Tax=Lutibacter sp. TaxID=1925666 RepID=UPI00299D33E4|nr:TolC family protein [Lutibacter sp.]MDX1830045.1 TolC family protein [Lutibacter sp.]
MKKIPILILIFFALQVNAQDALSLKGCYNLVAKNYPLAKQTDLLTRQAQLENAIVAKNKLPKLDFLAQSTYQSDVTFLPVAIPNTSVEPPNKDQYKATISVNQLIYNDGLIKASTSLKKSEFETKQQQVSVNLYQLKYTVNQLYFSILLLQEKTLLLKSKESQLQSKLKEVNAGIKYGEILPASNQVLEAELLKIDQQLTDVQNTKNNLFETLSSIIGKKITETTILKNPKVTTDITLKINRPETKLFELQKNQINASEEVLSKKNAPKLVGFATGGYGNPGLNMLDNSFQTFYMVGVKLNWNIFDWNAVKKQKQSLEINKDIINNQHEIFNLNTNIELQKQVTQISKLKTFIKSDKQIIELRENVLKTAESQLKNGVITSSAYLTEFTNLYEAKNNLNTHNIQLLLAKATYNTTLGN